MAGKAIAANRARGSVGPSRQTRPGGYNPYSTGGLEAIPRRQDLRNATVTPLIDSASSLRFAAMMHPLRVLQLLGDVDPLVSKAQRNVLTLSCAPGDARIVAVAMPTSPQAGAPPPAAGGNRNRTEGDTADATDVDAELLFDPEGTRLIEALWSSQAQEIGGLKGLRKALTLAALYTGLLVVEVVPGATGEGVKEVWPVDSLTIEFKRSAPNSAITPAQSQGGVSVNLDTERVLWAAIDAAVDNPYGRPIYSAVLPTGLARMSFTQDLRDAVHNSAWKRMIVRYSLSALYEIAKERLGLPDEGVDDDGNPTHPAADWVNGEVEAIEKYLGSLNADDNMSVDSADGGGVDSVDGADLAGIEPVIKSEQLAMIQALDELPTMVGVDGAGFNFGSVAWAVRAQSLEDLRDDVLQLLVRVADMHLRYLGLPLRARAETQPIRTTDRLVEANARSIETQTELTLYGAGIESAQGAARKLTNHGPADESRMQKINVPAVGGGAKAQAQPGAGSTREETAAATGANG